MYSQTRSMLITCVVVCAVLISLYQIPTSYLCILFAVAVPALLALSFALLDPRAHFHPITMMAHYWIGNTERLRRRECNDQRYSSLSDELTEIDRKILSFITYDPENATCLETFNIVKKKTRCVFAKQAKLWGCCDWKDNNSLEENVYRSAPTFYKFCLTCDKDKLDGFLFALPGEQYGKDMAMFAESVRRVLYLLSDLDPHKRHCMAKSYMDKPGWVYEFAGVTFFITTFAGVYPESHSRYAYGSRDVFILMQPEVSFLHHNLTEDTPVTAWDNPQTMRDKIRVAFRNAHQDYFIRDTIHYPMAHDVVKPLVDDGYHGVVEWWKRDKT